MEVKGFATVMAGSLACNVIEEDWNFSIRRTDGKTHGPFFDFHEKPVTSNDVKGFLPSWENIEWIEINDSSLSKSESYAKDSEFKVNVLSNENGNKTHKEVIEAFLEFMKKT